MIERTAQIFNVQKYNMYDGPGVRTLVFFQGCPLRCLWCSNPESQPKRPQVLFKLEHCTHCGACAAVCPVSIHRIGADGSHTVDREKRCIGCRACEKACPQSALAIAGEEKSISELLEIIEEDRPFYETSGGGVTLGGGEVLMQPEAAVSLLAACRQRGIHTAIETCGYARPTVIEKAAEVVDLFLFDLKHMDSERHYQLTGVRNEMILDNLRWLLENRKKVKIRLPLLRGLNDGEHELGLLLDFLTPYQDYANFLGVDLLPYHRMGVGKYRQLGRKYPMEGDPKLGEAELARIEAAISGRHIDVTIVRH